MPRLGAAASLPWDTPAVWVEPSAAAGESLAHSVLSSQPQEATLHLTHRWGLLVLRGICFLSQEELWHLTVGLQGQLSF